MTNQAIDIQLQAKILEEVKERASVKFNASVAKKEGQEAREILLELDNL
jgi:hypothetical protein